MAPHARAFLALEGLPMVDIDRTRAPAIFHHEGRGRPGIERSDEIAGMAAKRHGNAACFAERQIVALPDVVETEQLHHQVMNRILAGLDEGKTVMARIDMEEARHKRMRVIVGQSKTERIAVKCHETIYGLRRIDIEHDMAKAERAGAKARNRAAGLERIARYLGAVKNLEPVGHRIVEHDQILDMALVGQRPRSALDPDVVVLKMRGEGVECRGVGDFPAEKADALPAIGVDDQPLLAVVHAKSQRRARLVDALQPEQVRAIARPIAQILGANTDIAQSLKHGPLWREML